MKRWLALAGVALAAACGSPTRPVIIPPPQVGPATPPIVRSIAVPASRVETATDVTLTAVVEDAETPLAQLTYVWAASAGTVTGNGATAVWRHPAGLFKGVDVVITLTVVDTYDAVVNNQIVKQEYRVVQQAAPFRVHDSETELKELARKFLVDLFGNSSIAPADCLVDFSELCASGKQSEFDDIVDHRKAVEVVRVTMFGQEVTIHSPTSATVISDTEFLDSWLSDNHEAPNRAPFGVTAIYDQQRWWLCTSFVIRPDGTTERAFQSYRRKGDKGIGMRK